MKISQETEFQYFCFATSCSLYLKSIVNELLGSFRVLHRCPLIPFCSMFDSHVFPHIPFTSTINVALKQGISVDTGCESGAHYPLLVLMMKKNKQTHFGDISEDSPQKLPHRLVSIHRNSECQLNQFNKTSELDMCSLAGVIYTWWLC